MKKNVFKTYLANQCLVLPGAVRAVLVTGRPDEGPFDQAIGWPEHNGDPESLLPVAQAALRSKQAVVKTRNSQVADTGEPLDALACPLLLQERLLGVVAIEMTHRSEPMQRAAVQQVRTGLKWLEAMVSLHGTTARAQLVHLVELVAAGLEHDPFKAAATTVANEIAARFDCRQVAMGFMRRHRIRIEALSQATVVDPQSNVVRAMAEAMTESLDQGAIVVVPPDARDAALVTRCHDRLADMLNGATICTLPLVMNGRAVGAMLLERDTDTPFDAETVARCEQVGLLLGPVLETRRREARPLALKILDAFREGFGKLFGPRHLKLKAGVGLTAAMLVWLCLANGMLRISGDTVLEANAGRAIVAPQHGYIAKALVRAGDIVREGELLATLDDETLRLEQRKWESRRAQLLKEYRKSLAVMDRAELAILSAKRDQAEAQLKLVAQQLARTQLTAPFSGLVVKGDLSQALGSPVQPGEVLFELAPGDNYRVVMKVDDRDIGLIKLGQKGRLKLSGLPDRAIPITIDRLMPVSTPEGGRNYFRVEAVMADRSDLMRPGMTGIAKIEIQKEKMLRIWTRRLAGWLQLLVWKRMP